MAVEGVLRQAIRLAIGLVAVLAAATPAAAATTAAPASFLTATVVPAQIPAGGSAGGAIYVELVSASGRAATRPGPLSVAISAAEAGQMGLPAEVTIPPGTSAVRVPIRSPLAVGTVPVQLQAPGMPVADVRIEVTQAAGPGAGAQLHLTLAPATFFAGARTAASWATVVLEGAKGAPAVTPAPLRVALVSSDPAALRVPPGLTLPAGSFSATVPVRIGQAGVVSVTALASGYLASTVPTRVFAAGGTPASLRVTAMPDAVLPGSTVRLVVQALDAHQVPVPFPCGTLEVASSDPAVLGVAATAAPMCRTGQQAVVVDTRAGDASGGTHVTVAESGLTSADVQLSATGAAPTSLAATVAPAAVMFGQAHSGWLVVQALDSAGLPVSAVGPIQVTLSGGGGLLPATAMIPPGDSAVAVRMGRIPAGSTAVVTATAPGLRPASVDLAALAGRGATHQAQGLALRLGGLRIPVAWLLALLVVATGLLIVVLMRGGGEHTRRPPAA